MNLPQAGTVVWIVNAGNIRRDSPRKRRLQIPEMTKLPNSMSDERPRISPDSLNLAILLNCLPSLVLAQPAREVESIAVLRSLFAHMHPDLIP